MAERSKHVENIIIKLKHYGKSVHFVGYYFLFVCPSAFRPVRPHGTTQFPLDGFS
jgi:hypothetical protein